MQYLYLNRNSFSGTIPSEIGSLSNLQYLILENNLLTGIIPVELGSLYELEYLYLFDNNLSGPLPSELGYLANLIYLDASENSLSGPISPELESLFNLQTLNIGSNFLTGSLPVELGSLPQLLELYVSRNLFTGHIPVELGSLIDINELDLHDNLLSGPIPAELGSLSKLNLFSAQMNLLSRRIPSELGMLSNLRKLVLFQNYLTGTIPAEIGLLSNLQQLFLHENLLSGTIPSSLSFLTSVRYLYLSNNLLTGTIPDALGNTTSLVYLSLSFNELIGSIPSSFAGLSKLGYLFLCNNMLDGGLEPLGGLTNMTWLIINDNRFTGRYYFPFSFFYCFLLEYLKYIEKINQYAGFLPIGLRNMLNLQILDVTFNNLRGSIPENTFNSTTQLETLFLGSNLFSGALPSISACTSLERVDISGNIFSGSIPEDFFDLPNLILFSASVNCILPQLPASLCRNSQIKELYMNGLQQNKMCKYGSTQKSLISLPSCIWSMYSLRKLYISGNAYTGILENFNLTNISSLSIDSNHLSGSLPAELNGKLIQYFDISSNHFSGTMDKSQIVPVLPQNSVYKSNNNRLSGPVLTDGLYMFSSINVLRGNIISCSTLPRNDPDLASYSCGSSDYEFSIYFWLGSACFALCSVCIRFYYAPELFHKWRASISTGAMMGSNRTKTNYPLSVQFVYSLTRLMIASVLITLIVLGLTIIVYFSLKFGDYSSKYKTHTYQYQFLLTGLFMKGNVPAFCLVSVFFIIFILVLSVYYRVFVVDWSVMRLECSEIEMVSNKSINSDYDLAKSAVRLAVNLLALLSCLMIVLMGNLFYVYISNDVTFSELIILQLSLYMFNGLFRVGISPLIEFMLPNRSNSGLTTMVIVTALGFVDIVTPLVATLVGDQRCFYDVISEQDEVNTSFQYESCILGYAFDKVCINQLVHDRTLSFKPPFIYSNDCRDAVMTNFLPVMIISSAFQAFIIPLANFLFTCGHDDLNAEITILGVLRLGRLKDLTLSGSRMRLKMAQIWSSFQMLVTFGILSPCVAIALGTSILSQILVLRASTCRYYFLLNMSDPNLCQPDDKHIEIICRDSQTSLHFMLWPPSIMSCIVFALYVFDLAYDTSENSLREPLIALILTILILPVSYCMFNHYQSKQMLRRDQIIRSSVELSTVISPLATFARTHSDKDYDKTARHNNDDV